MVAALAAPVGFAGVGVAAGSRPATSPTTSTTTTPAGSNAVLVAQQPAGHLVGFFTNATCSVSRGGVFTARSSSLIHGRYIPKHTGIHLLVRIRPFTGFKEYPLRAGTVSGPYIPSFAQFTNYLGTHFSTNFVPPYKVASGGAVQFSDDGNLIGVGFEPVYNASGSEIVIFTGVMRCHWKHKPK